MKKIHPETLASHGHKALTHREMFLNLIGRLSELWASAWDFEERTSLILLKSGSPWVLNVEEYI